MFIQIIFYRGKKKRTPRASHSFPLQSGSLLSFPSLVWSPVSFWIFFFGFSFFKKNRKRNPSSFPLLAQFFNAKSTTFSHSNTKESSFPNNSDRQRALLLLCCCCLLVWYYQRVADALCKGTTTKLLLIGLFSVVDSTSCVLMWWEELAKVTNGVDWETAKENRTSLFVLKSSRNNQQHLFVVREAAKTLFKEFELTKFRVVCI